MQTRSSFALGGAVLLFCVWMLATWLLEGRNETLLRGMHWSARSMRSSRIS